ncbi:MAG: porin family protein [Chitinophagaceae bacterium]|nr:porin family protein [Chitinophagaceae bacterium]
MKKLLLAVTAFFVSLTSFAQIEFGFGYSNQSPLGDMAGNINAAHGFNFQIGYRFPFAGKQLVASFETGTGRYGKKKVTQSFQSEDMSTPAEYPVHYINFANYNHLNVRYELVKNKAITPYVQAMGGLQSLGTRVRINVYGEDDRDDCAPLENEVTFRKNTFTYGYGAGLLMKLGGKSTCSPMSGTSINLSISRIHGGRIDYVNVKQLEQPAPANQDNGESKPLTMQFVNLNTSRIHNHTVAQLYNSPLQQLQVKLGILFDLR